MDGPWQIGHKTADKYGRLACEAAVGTIYHEKAIQRCCLYVILLLGKIHYLAYNKNNN